MFLLVQLPMYAPCLQELKQLGVGCDILRCNKGVLNRRQTPFLQPYSEIIHNYGARNYV